MKSLELAVVVPTLNEAENINPLLNCIDLALEGLSWEIIFVDDDSRDGTLDVLQNFATERQNVRYLWRIGRRGLSSACIEGMLSTSAPYIAVMDCDLQHDERLLSSMLDILKKREVDIVIASRYMEGSGINNFSAKREQLSRWGILLSRLVVKSNLTDPLSGFFMLRRELLSEVAPLLCGKGYKILLDIFSSASRPLTYEEIPLQFRERHSGSSKLDTVVAVEFLYLLADKLFGKVIPFRFVLFVLVGLSGVLIHILLLGLFFIAFDTEFFWSQVVATIGAMTTNFYFNNIFTYRDRRLKGIGFLKGLLSFYAACAIGAVINVQMADFLFSLAVPWALAGLLGAVIGSIWNYGVTSTITWRARTRSTSKVLSAPQ